MPLRSAFALLLLAGLVAAKPVDPARAAEPGAATVELVLPHRATDDQAPRVQVRVGALPRGAEVVVATADGARLGSVSPFGFRNAQQGGSYTFPLPSSAITDGRVTLHLQVTQPGAAMRAPTADEVESVTLIYVPVSR